MKSKKLLISHSINSIHGNVITKILNMHEIVQINILMSNSFKTLTCKINNN